MEITPKTKYARLQILQHAFRFLDESYRQRNEKIAWRIRDNGVAISPDDIWTKHVAVVESVRNDYMHFTDGLLDRHKIIASTSSAILEIQPLNIIGIDSSSNDHYLLNAEYAIYFGIQYLASFNRTYPKEPFYPDTFFGTFYETDKGFSFLKEHLKLLCAERTQPIPIFWAAHLWFALEQWGLAHMREKHRFPPQVTVVRS